MEERQMICIRCPIGCRLMLFLNEDGMLERVEGAGCNRGTAYATEEMTDPRRLVTTIMRVQGRQQPVSVRTNVPIPKASIRDCLLLIRGMQASADTHAGDVLIKNVLDSGADIIATADAG